jgi:Mitochondrial carrier protein
MHVMHLTHCNILYLPRGLYGGIGIHLMRSVPNAAVMFVTFEVVSKWLLKKQMQTPTIIVESVLEKKSKNSRRPVAMTSPVNFKTGLSSPILSLRL